MTDDFKQGYAEALVDIAEWLQKGAQGHYKDLCKDTDYEWDAEKHRVAAVALVLTRRAHILMDRARNLTDAGE